VRGVGVPRANEIDPTPILALTTPIMFGFMFGDIGQGAVLVLLGYILKNRLPILNLLIPAGIASIFFGFMHGTVFCNEALIRPLWLHPLDHPLVIMSVALLFGGFMLLISLVLAGIQAYWQQSTATWVATQLPLIGLGMALLALFWNPKLSGMLLVAALLISVVSALRKTGPAGAVVAILKLLEDAMQLAINMLSFIRLGAFTLAHCGLSTAVMVLTAIPDSIVLQFLIFVLGNILIIALEGLVVSIQTTRLVMFEFFRRFMEGAGRPFKPLTDPAVNPT
jgi:V/A-type H+-transporting ATPase subunit I